jgi:oxygen-dependent protoporphyrinogen oxidase
MRHQMKNRPAASRESGARYSMFVTLEDGLSSLVEAIAARLPAGAVRLNTPVTRLERFGDRWRVWVEDRGDRSAEDGKGDGAASSFPAPRPASLLFDALVLATPSPAAAKLLQPLDETLAAELALITHSGTAILSLGYAREQIGHPLDGMGMVVPAIENSPILACSFSSRKYPHRAPAGKELLRVFVGGARRPEMAEMDDQRLQAIVLDELSRRLGIRGEPCYCNIAHWPGTMPQYHVGHNELVARIEARVTALPHLALAGNAYHGVGLPDCIHGGELAAERIM